MLRIWGSLRCLLSKGRQDEQSGPVTTVKGGLFHVYNTLSKSDVNLPGRSSIDFSHFSEKPAVRRRAVLWD